MNSKFFWWQAVFFFKKKLFMILCTDFMRKNDFIYLLGSGGGGTARDCSETRGQSSSSEDPHVCSSISRQLGQLILGPDSFAQTMGLFPGCYCLTRIMASCSLSPHWPAFSWPLKSSCATISIVASGQGSILFMISPPTHLSEISYSASHGCNNSFGIYLQPCRKF